MEGAQGLGQTAVMAQPPAKPPAKPAAAPAAKPAAAPAKPAQAVAAKPAAPPAKPAAAPAKPAAPPAAAVPVAAKPAAPPAGPEVMHPDAQKLGLTPKDADKFFRQAVAFYERQDWGGAVDSIRVAITCNKTIAKYWVLFGASFAHLGMVDYAMMAFNRSLELDPTDISAWVSVGELQIVNKDFSSAQKALQKAVELDKSGDNPSAKRARMLLVARKQWQHGIPQLPGM